MKIKKLLSAILAVAISVCLVIGFVPAKESEAATTQAGHGTIQISSSFNGSKYTVGTTFNIKFTCTVPAYCTEKYYIEVYDANDQVVGYKYEYFQYASVSGSYTYTLTVPTKGWTAGKYTVIYASDYDLSNGYYKSATFTLVQPKYKKGQTFTVGGMKYKVTNASSKTVELVKGKKATSVTVPATVTSKGQKFKVTSIGSKAFEKNTKVKTVVIGSYVTKIGSKAFNRCTNLKTVKVNSTKLTTIGSYCFYKCSKLTTVTIKSKKLTSSKVGKYAFKGIKSTCTFKVPSSKKSAYKTIFRKAGASSRIKVTKY